MKLFGKLIALFSNRKGSDRPQKNVAAKAGLVFCSMLTAGVLQAAPAILDFKNPVIVNGGADLAVGTQYRFQNVANPGGVAVDALVTIESSVGASLTQFDDNVIPFSTASDFRPVVQADGSIPNGSPDGSYVNFLFEFVLNSDNSTAINIELDAYSMDVDGSNSGMREYVIISSFAGYTINNPTQLNYIDPGRFESSTDLVNPGVGPNSEWLAKTEYSSISTFTYRAGVLRDAGTASVARLFALAFEPIAFDTPVVTAIPPGTVSGSVKDSANNPVVGAKVKLVKTDGSTVNDINGNPILEATVNATTGAFSFADVPVGNYVLIETNPAGYTSTGESSDQTNDPVNSSLTDDEIPVSVATAEAESGNNFIDDAPDISVAKALTTESGSTANVVEAGETLTYTITLSNAGGSAGTITIDETVPAGTTFVAAGNDFVTAMSLC